MTGSPPSLWRSAAPALVSLLLVWTAGPLLVGLWVRGAQRAALEAAARTELEEAGAAHRAGLHAERFRDGDGARLLERDVIAARARGVGAHARDGILFVTVAEQAAGGSTGFARVASPSLAGLAAGATWLALFLLTGPLAALRIRSDWRAAQRERADQAALLDFFASLGRLDFGHARLQASVLEVGAAGSAAHRALHERFAALEAESARLHGLLAGMGDPVVAVDAAGRVLFMNRPFRDLVGIPPGSDGVRFLWEVCRNESLRTTLEAALASPGPVTANWSSTAGSHFQISVSPIAVDGSGRTGRVVIFADVSELKRVEKMKSDFVANVSHELRTPLQAMGGALEALERAQPEDHARFLAMARRHVERLSNLTRDVLSLHRLEAAGSRLTRSADVDLPTLLEEVRTVAAGLAQRKGQEVTVRCAAPLTMRTDRDLLEMVLVNLLENAVKYTPEGGRITVDARVEGDGVVLDVEDTGPGIPEALRERVFERFFRVDAERSRAAGGTGLGLAIVKHAVSSLGGEVRCLEGAAGGALFRVTLPQ